MFFSHPSSRPVASGRMPLRVELLEDRVVPTHSPLGPEFPVGLLTPQQSSVSVGRTAVAMDADGDFVVAWAESQLDFNRDTTIFARRYDRNGTPVTDAIVVAQFTSESISVVDVAMDEDGDFVVVYDQDPVGGSEGDIFFRRYAFDGSAKDPAGVRVDGSDSDRARLPAVSMDSAGNFVVAFTDNSFFGEVYFRRFTAAGVGDANITQVSTSDFAFGGGAVDVASDGAGNFVIVWDAVNENETLSIASRRYDLNGNPLDGSPVQVNQADLQTSFSTPSVGRARDTGAFVVVWNDFFFPQDSEFGLNIIMARQFQADGTGQAEFQVDQPTALDPEAGISRPVSISSARPDVAVDAHGDFAIVYQTQDSLFLSSLDDGPILLDIVFPSDTDPTQVSRVLLRTFRADGTEDDPQQFASSQSSSLFPGPVVASDDCGDLALAWHGFDFGPGFVSDSGVDSILARVYRTSDICEEPETPKEPEIPPVVVVIDPRDPAQAIVLTQRVELLLAPFLLELSAPTLFQVPITLSIPERFNPPLSANVGGSLVIGELRGRVWDDLNGNGMQDSDEKGVPGQIVFLDTNGNGKLDDNEPFTTTDENGDYVFSNLPFGEFQVWQDLRSRRYRQTMPERNEPYTVRLSPTQPLVVNLNFGNKEVRAPVSAPTGKNNRDVVPRKEKGKGEPAEPSKPRAPSREQPKEAPPPQETGQNRGRSEE